MRTALAVAALAMVFVAAPSSAAGGAERPTAAQVLKESGVAAGLAVVVGTTDPGAPGLEADLTNGGKVLVQGLALSDEAAAKAREHLFEKKLYGLASVARVASARTLPYYDRIANLLVADLDALGKDAPSKEEIDRVLGYEGVAYLKQGGKWTKSVLKTPPDIDSWTHYAYDASQNPVSKDLVVGPVNAFRWTDGPFTQHLIGGFRTSDGVAVQINGAYLNPAKSKFTVPSGLDGVRLWARDASSGVLLWHRPILPDRSRLSYAGTYTETFVAAGGRVYIYDFLDENQVALTALDLRTGTVERVFDRGAVCRKADMPDTAPDRRGRQPDWRQWANDTFAWSMVLVADGKVVQMVRDKIFVLDAATGRVLWKKETGDETHYLKVLVSGDRLVALRARTGAGVKQGGWATRSGDLVAMQAWRWADGTPLWQQDLSGLAYPTGSHEVLFHQNFAAHGPHLLMPHEKGLRLMSAEDGGLIWDQPVRVMIGYHIIRDRIWLGHGGSSVFGGVLMLATGEKDPTPRSGGTNQSACDAPTATVKWFMGKRNFIPVEPKPDWPQWVSMRCFGKKCGERAACSYGSVFGVSPMCGCDQFIRGSGAWYAVREATPVKDEQRLAKRGPAPLGPVAAQTEARKALPATFWVRPEGLESFWFTTNFRWSTPIHHWPGYGLTQTTPVQAGDLTLVAHVHEHRLAATRGGQEVWNFVAGGRIGAPPVLYRGRAIFGCHDGNVYAVDLRDGSLAWRFLAAPVERQHMMLGQLESATPVFNVVLGGDNLYCSAGRHEELDGGIHFYSLDAATGAVRWHVSRRRGMESDLEPYRQRKNYAGQRGEVPGVLSDGRAQMNDRLELREGKLWLHGVPLVDVSAPKDDVMYARTVLPPQLMEAKR
jgi:outer membrane protein assembly factor BamB